MSMTGISGEPATVPWTDLAEYAHQLVGRWAAGTALVGTATTRWLHGGWPVDDCVGPVFKPRSVSLARCGAARELVGARMSSADN